MENTYTHIVYVSFSEASKMYTFGTNDATLQINDKVVVETVRGLEVGTVMKDTERSGCSRKQ